MPRISKERLAKALEQEKNHFARCAVSFSKRRMNRAWIIKAWLSRPTTACR